MKLKNGTNKDIMAIVGYDDAGKKIPRWKAVKPGAEVEVVDELAKAMSRKGFVGLLQAQAPAPALKAEVKAEAKVEPALVLDKGEPADPVEDIKGILGRRKKRGA